MCLNKTYTMVLRSVDKISGSNSNANYLINWERILPKEFQEFNVRITMMTNLFRFDSLIDPVSIESRIFMGKVSLQDTCNIDSLVHHSRIFNTLNTSSENTWYNSLNKDHIYSIQRSTDNIINIRNYSFESTKAGSTNPPVINLSTGWEIH